MSELKPRFRLVRPQKKHEKEAFHYLAEYQAVNGGDYELHGLGQLDNFVADYDGWLTKLEVDRRQASNEERVPAETYFLVEEQTRAMPGGVGAVERIIGMVNVRLRLNLALWNDDGNIGFSIRPSERRKGYAKLLLFLSLGVCQRHGIEAVLLDCSKANIGSAKTIRALGGKLIREYSPVEGITVQQYVIDVNAALKFHHNEYVGLAN